MMPPPAPPAPRCPYCGEDRQIERVGAKWVCNVCAKDWPVARLPLAQQVPWVPGFHDY